TSYLLASFYNSWDEGARGQLEISLATVVHRIDQVAHGQSGARPWRGKSPTAHGRAPDRPGCARSGRSARTEAELVRRDPGFGAAPLPAHAARYRRGAAPGGAAHRVG